MKRGQLFSGEFMLTLFIFLMLLAAVLASQDAARAAAAETAAAKELELAAIRAADALVSAESNLTIVRWNNAVNDTLLAAFLALDYVQSKERLGIAGYDYHFALANWTKGSAGGNYSVVVRRAVLYNGSRLMNFTVWK